MTRVTRLFIPIVLIMLIACPSIYAGSVLDDALAFQDLSMSSIIIDKSDLEFRGEKGNCSIPLLSACRKSPFQMSRYCKVLGEGALTSSSSLPILTNFASLRTGHGQYRGWLESPLEVWKKNASGVSVLTYELEMLYGKFDEKLPRKLKKKLDKEISLLPPEAISAAIIYLRAVESSLKWRKQAFRNLCKNVDINVLYHELVGDYTYVQARASENGRGNHPAQDIAKMMDTWKNVDFEMLYTGGHEMAIAVDYISKLLVQNTNCAEEFSFSIPTPLGEIVVGGSGENFYQDGKEYLLIIDLGGDDNYRTGASNLSGKNPISSIIDICGNDIYYAEMVAPAFGSGVLGYGFLIDCAGNDYYKVTSLGLGSGLYGVGGLIDKDGKDTYIAISYGCGSATFGIGVQADYRGDDTYDVFHRSGGYAGPLAAGILVDSLGDDRYVARDDDIRFPSAQSDIHNSSSCFGAAFGRRADFKEGHSLNGGFALLTDGGGNDTYSAGVFALGIGYWGGVGMLYDRSGNDSYKGQWYVIGATAHFAASAFVDLRGNDTYEAKMNMGIGAAHDYSVSSFEDSEGNDTYLAPNLSLGAGNSNAIGLFFEYCGDDEYVSKGITLGASSIGSKNRTESRYFSLSFGLFLDVCGKDKYSAGEISPRTEKPSDGITWFHKRANSSPYEKGIGLDIQEPGLTIK